MLRGIHLKGVGPAPEMELALAPRLNLLTGDNGVGKSFLLDIAWWALTGDWAGHQAWPDVNVEGQPQIEYEIEGQESVKRMAREYDYGAQSWIPPAETPVLPPSVVLYARVDGTFSLWDSARNLWGPPMVRRGPVPKLSFPYHFSVDELWNGLKDDDRVLCEGLIRDWVSWQERKSTEFIRLQRVLKALSPKDEERLLPGPPTRVSVRDVRDIPTLQTPYGTIPLIFASAAVQRIVGLAYLLVWAWQEHCEVSRLLREPEAERVVFLIDEIESHLHPKWQRLILPALLSVMQVLRSDVQVQALVTTHAPLVLASVEPEFDVERDALFLFDLAGSQVQVSKQDWYRRGDASAWLTSDVFDLKEARSLPAEKAIQKAMEAMRKPDLPMEETKRIHGELRSVLKDTDPFWPRWLIRAKAAGLEP